ncbi:membrane protein FAM174A isoform X2 [Moschus berezovskii]|uniref:membrane protein FAM174A isoform X1 n=1 Tax=Moschus berezovskii TaxID=68408 RepID=UPI00244467F1|nr:membrane protein FAM174A isoform X1 [Moschus berezovskii]XP_055285674.1 membrane protein FAM174A isoform X2 [Moschus berezovskii]
MRPPLCSCRLSRALASALLLSLLLPELGGPSAGRPPAARAAPAPGAPPSPGPSAARAAAGRAPAPEAAGARGAGGGNGSAAAGDPGGEAGPAGGVLAVSPEPGDRPMTQRALTVLMVVSGAVLVYFVVRTVRMRRRNRKTRRYGVLDTNIENMELTPLEQDDEEEDNTLFDASHPRR